MSEFFKATWKVIASSYLLKQFFAQFKTLPTVLVKNGIRTFAQDLNVFGAVFIYRECLINLNY